MNSYVISLTYMDDKVINLALSEEEVSKFLENLKKSEPYWAPKGESAFWASNESVRYVNIIKQAPPVEPTKVEPTKVEPIIKADPVVETKEGEKK